MNPLKLHSVNPRLWTAVLSLLIVAAVILLSVLIAPPAAVLSILITFVIFMFPGIFLGPLLTGGACGSWIERTIIGMVAGIALSSYAAIAVGFVFGWSPKLIVAAILGLTGICAAMGRAFRARPLVSESREWEPAEYVILAAMFLLVVVFCALPYMNVGKLTSHGYGYTWLFGIDLLGRADYISAMVHRFPPDNLWMTGVPLRMYLVGYAIPAFAYTLKGTSGSLHALVLLETLGLNFVMLGCLYIFLRKFFFGRTAMLGMGILAVVSYSYYWVYDLAKWIFTKPGEYPQFLSDPHFWYYDNVSHLFQRVFLVEPQAALATSILLVMLSLLTQVQYKLSRVALGVALGVCMGIGFGTDAIQGLVVVAWFGLVYFVRLLSAKDRWREEAIPFLGSAAACGLIAGSFFLLGMYKSSTSNMVSFKFNLWIFLFGLAFFPVEFGPLLFLGVWGAIRWWKQNRPEFGWPLVFLGAVVLAQVAFVFQYATPRARMADRLFPVILLVFAGYSIRYLASPQASQRARWLAALIVLAGIPTFFTDAYFASNVQDEYHTRYVSVEDRLACDWIRNNLPETAIVQGETDYFTGADHGHYLSVIASFAGRPQVLGWLSGAAVLVDRGWDIAEERQKDILTMLNATDVSSVVEVVQKYSIEYVYVGPFEQKRHKNFLPLLQSAPDQFQEIYNSNSVRIFHRLVNGVTRAKLSPAAVIPAE